MWFYTVLLAPIVSALAIVLSKHLLKNMRAGVLTWATYTFSSILVALVAFSSGVPKINSVFFIGIIGSTIFYVVSKVMSFKSMRQADLSLIYPLSSLGPIFTLVVAYFPPLNEKPHWLAIVGILVTLFGCYLLNINSLKNGLLMPIKTIFRNRASTIMFWATLIGSMVAIFDKLAINNTQPINSAFTLFAEDILISLSMLPILLWQDRNFLKPIIKNAKMLSLVVILTGISNLLVMNAMGTTNIAYVATILRTQLLFVLLFSYLMFKDKPKKEIILGSLIMIFGVILIKLGA